MVARKQMGAKKACQNTGIAVFDHFADVGKLSKRGINAGVEIIHKFWRK